MTNGEAKNTSVHSLRRRILGGNAMLVSVGLLALAVQLVVGVVLSQGQEAYTIAKTAGDLGKFETNASVLEGALAFAGLSAKFSQPLALDDIEIAADEVKSSTLNLAAQLATLPSLAASAIAIEAALGKEREAVAALLDAKDPKFQSGLVLICLDQLKQLATIVHEVRSGLNSLSQRNFAFSVLIERVTLVSIVASIAAFLVVTTVNVMSVRKIAVDLVNLIEGVNTKANQLASVSATLITTSRELSQSATEQAAAVEESSAAMEEISAMMRQTSDRAVTSLAAAKRGIEEAAGGVLVVERLAQAMDELNASNKKMERMTEIIREISNKSHVINDIAFETKVLSFNASIESARAGIHGRGFSVIAGEVGKLAAVSNSAADEVRSLIETSGNEVSVIVAESSKKVETGHHISRECESVFGGMGESLTGIVSSVEGIALATREQNIGVDQTKVAMNQIDRVTQQNSRLAIELIVQAESVSGAAIDLLKTAGGLKDFVLGPNANREIKDVKVLPQNSSNA